MNNIKSYLSIIMICAMCVCITTDALAQQDAQYTQYMYNTMSINPAYVGSKGYSNIVALTRTQWVGFDKAPDSQTLSFDTSFGRGVGFGVNLGQDKIGPSRKISLDVNTSYTLKLGQESRLAFGLKLGARKLDIDWSKGKTASQSDPNYGGSAGVDPVYSDNVDKYLPTVGLGFYFHRPKWYVGFSVPSLLSTKQPSYKEAKKVAYEDKHYFAIVGYVFDLSDNVKFKPTALFKVVPGAPVISDFSTNFLFNNKFTAGLAWRWEDSVSALLGFRINPNFSLGYAYDMTTSKYRNTNKGTHEIMFRYSMFKQPAMLSPRFF